MFSRKIYKVTSQSILKNIQIFCLRNFLWQIVPLVSYAYKKRIFKTILSCWCKLKTHASYDAYSLLIRVQTTINHILICFPPQYQRQRNCFFRGQAEKGIVRHIYMSSTVWTLIYNGKLANQIARLAVIVVKTCFANEDLPTAGLRCSACQLQISVGHQCSHLIGLLTVVWFKHNFTKLPPNSGERSGEISFPSFRSNTFWTKLTISFREIV